MTAIVWLRLLLASALSASGLASVWWTGGTHLDGKQRMHLVSQTDGLFKNAFSEAEFTRCWICEFCC